MSALRPVSPWLEVAGPAEPQYVLLALPYAGGSSRVFRSWATTLAAGWGLAVAELPGHGRRMGEPCLRDPAEVQAALLEQLPALSASRLAVLGYSLGGWLALDLAAALTRAGTPPSALVTCACRAPQTGMGHPPLADLPRDDFLARAIEYGLADPRMRTMPELGAAFADVLQADLTMVERYRYTGPLPLDVPLGVLGADGDWLATEPSLRAWSAVSAHPAVHARIPGGHLVIETDPKLVSQAVWDLIGQLGVS